MLVFFHRCLKLTCVVTLAVGCYATAHADESATKDQPINKPAEGANELKPIDFAHDVVPVLKKHCVECHGGKESKGGFSLNTRALVLDAEAAEPGDAAASRMVELITSDDPEDQMPPKDRPRLAAAEIDVLSRWVEQELPWQEGFSFAERRYEPPLKPRAVELPPPITGRNHPVDRILDNYLAERKLPSPRPLDDATFVRRLSLDVHGLLPTPDELEQFLADTATDKRERLIQRILADDTAYAQHWLTFWNDLLRNAYSGTGYIDGGRKQITPWLYESLLTNKPYDAFVRELIAPPAADSQGFIRGIKWRGNVNASQTREIQFAQNITQVFLGINMKCASCHDSFIDRWTLQETYDLAAVFSNSKLEIHRCDKPTGETATAAWIFPELGEIDASAPQPKRLAQLAALMTHRQNGRLTRTVVNRIWHRLMGRGIVHPVDAMHTEPFSADLLDYLAEHLVREGYDLKKTIELVVTSSAYQSQAVAVEEQPKSDAFVYRGPLAKRMTAEQFLDSVWQITDTWPRTVSRAWKVDGRGQGGQLAAVLDVEARTGVDPSGDKPANPSAAWGDRPVRAALTPLDPLQASLGRPNREQVVTTRPDLLTTLEAINLANGEILAATLARGADQLVQRHSDSAENLIDVLFTHSLSRSPTPLEREIAQQLVGSPPTREGVADLLWTVIMLPEFQLIR